MRGRDANSSKRIAIPFREDITMGKIVLMLAAAMLILPSNLRADSSVDFFFNGGTLVGNNSGLSLSGGALDAVVGFGGPSILGPNLGTVNFSTGPLQSGTPEAGVFVGGGNLTILGGGANGIPAGVLFSGVFNQRSGWTPLTLSDGSHYQVLHGVLDGTFLGAAVADVPMELEVYSQGPSFSSAGQRIIGSVEIPVSVPEPASLAFLGMGALGLAGAMWTRFRTGKVDLLPQN